MIWTPSSSPPADCPSRHRRGGRPDPKVARPLQTIWSSSGEGLAVDLDAPLIPVALLVVPEGERRSSGQTSRRRSGTACSIRAAAHGAPHRPPSSRGGSDARAQAPGGRGSCHRAPSVATLAAMARSVSPAARPEAADLEHRQRLKPGHLREIGQQGLSRTADAPVAVSRSSRAILSAARMSPATSNGGWDGAAGRGTADRPTCPRRWQHRGAGTGSSSSGPASRSSAGRGPRRCAPAVRRW